ncbi:MAG TPA: hypothetical protein V6D33_01760 [Cyanophyceae cyanobacterium]
MNNTISLDPSTVLSYIGQCLQYRPTKTHDFTRADQGKDYVIEFLKRSTKAYMTGQKKGLKPGDYLIVHNGTALCRYQVEEIDYYCSPSDMWIALLKPVAVS